MTEAEELEYLRLKKRKALAMQAMPAANQPIPQASAAPQKPVDIMGANVNQMDAQGPDPSRIPGMTDYLQQSASEYEDRNKGGIQGSADAALFNIANMATFGGLRRAGNEAFEGTVNEGYGDAAVKESNTKYPGASVVGRGIGFAYPSAAPSGMAMRGTEHLATKAGVAMTKSTSVPGRVARYGTRVGIGSPVVASEIAAFEALSEAPTRAFMEGRDVKPAEMGAAAINAMGNPVNYLAGPALSIAGRTLKGMGTGVSTPKPIQQGVTRESGGAVPLSEGQLAADAVHILDAQAMNGIDPSGFKLVERILRQSGVGTNDIPAVNAKVGEILKAAPDTVAPRLTIGQVYAKALYDLDKTQASENILKVLRERRNGTEVKDRSPSIVGKEVRDLRSSQVDFVTQSAESNLGAGKRIDVKNAAADAKKQIGTQYERVLAEADPTRPEAGGLVQIIMSDPSAVAAAGPLNRRAINAGFTGPGGSADVASYVQAMPDAAAHWLRSHLAKAARTASGREKSDLQTTVQQLDELLDTNPGYAKARKDYGTEIGIDEAREIGNNFIAAARNQGNLDLLLEQIAALPARERDVALLSIRDNLMAPVRGSGEDAPARISQLVSVGTLDGMERLGPAGKRLADDIRAIRDENNFLGQIDSGNPMRQSATFSNADAAANAPDLYSGGIARTMNAGGGSSLPADIAVSAITGTPIAPFTLAKIARGGLQSVFAPGQKSKEAMTQFLMTRPRNTSPGNALATPPASSTAPPTPPGGPVSSSGLHALRSDAGNALSGGYAGSVIGSVDGMSNDVNGDGVIDNKDIKAGALRGSVIGAVGVPAYTRTSNALATRAYSKGVPAEVKTLAERMHKASGNRGGAFKDAPASYRTRLEAQAAKRLGVKIPEPPLRGQSFVGINSKDPAVVQRLNRAKEMEKAGASREEIWSETMSMKGADGKWRAEIDDSLASVPGYLMAGAKADGRLGEIIKHPDLYKSYPDMADIPTSFDGTQKARSGRYNPEDAFNDEGLSINSTNADDARSVGLHEAQHGIQSREGFARGGSPDEVPVRVSGAAAEAHARQIAKWGSVDYDSLSRTQQNKYKKLAADDLREKQRLNGYKNLAGETEARTVQTRRNMDTEQRRARPAWMDEDVSRNDQIVQYGNALSESRPPRGAGFTGQKLPPAPSVDDVAINPSKSDIRKMLARNQKSNRGANADDVSSFRWVQDASGQTYVFPALSRDHAAMWEKLVKSGVDMDTPFLQKSNRHMRGHITKDDAGNWQSINSNGQRSPLPWDKLPGQKDPVHGAGFTGSKPPKPPKIKPDVPLGTRSRVRQPLPDVTGDTVEPNRRLVKVMSEPAPQAPPRGRGDYNQKPLYTVRRQPKDTPGDLQKGDRLPAEGLKKKQNPILDGQGDGDRQWVLLSDSASGAKKAFERGQGMRKKNGNVQDVLYRGQAKTVNVPDTIFGNGKRMRDLVQSAFDDGAGVIKLVFRNGREVYVAKDASVLRSPRAGFDPAKSGSKDIMAVLPLAGVGGAGAVAANEGNALALPPRNEQGQFVKEAR